MKLCLHVLSLEWRCWWWCINDDNDYGDDDIDGDEDDGNEDLSDIWKLVPAVSPKWKKSHRDCNAEFELADGFYHLGYDHDGDHDNFQKERKIMIVIVMRTDK